MILWGVLDSPFVRRVAVALHHHGLPFERRALSVFGDFEEIRQANPLGQAPALTLDSGEVLTNTHAILDWLDHIAPATTLMPEANCLDVLQIEAVANGLADKAVGLNWETRHRPPELHWQEAIDRTTTQIAAALDWLDSRATSTPLFGTLTRADIGLACATRFMAEKHPALFTGSPALHAHLDACEALPPFAAAPFTFP